MNHLAHATSLRNDHNRHYNCCQSVLIPFAKEAGLDEEAAYLLGSHFGSGMRRGVTCGAVTGALMALGLLDCGEAASREFLRRFETENGSLDCAQLLKRNHEAGGDRKLHCDGMVNAAVRMVEELTQK